MIDAEPQDIMESYKAFFNVEEWFRYFKNDIEHMPVYHWKIESIKTHTFLCFLFMKIWSYYINALSKEYTLSSPHDIWVEMRMFKGATLKIKDSKYFIRNDPTENANKAFVALRAK